VALTRHLAILAALGALLVYATAASSERAAVHAQSGFAARIAALSEPEGYFDTDNLISNERSYLHVVPALERQTARGGAYIGVGPDQNFSYIAAVRPSIAFIVDIRRDNLLLHLLFKALFGLSRTRVEYLALLLGRTVPADVDTWRAADVARLVASVDGPRLDGPRLAQLRSRVDDAIRKAGVPLSREDMATIDRFHRRSSTRASVRFQSHDGCRWAIPELSRAAAGTDRPGKLPTTSRRAGVSVRQVAEARDSSSPSSAILPVRQRSRQSAGSSPCGASDCRRSTTQCRVLPVRRRPVRAFRRNLKQLPRTERSVLIRSVFRPWISGVSAGDGSISSLQPVSDLVGVTHAAVFSATETDRSLRSHDGGWITPRDRSAPLAGTSP
jgi:hypothetical protein